MYINNIHIISYIAVVLLGLIEGQFIDWCNQRLSNHEKVFTKEFFSEYLKRLKPKYILMIIVALINAGLLYKFNFTLSFFKYIVLAPMLISAFCIDYKLQIIPNRLTLTIFETGLIFTFLNVIINTNLGITTLTNSLLGMFVGGGVFLLITLIGGAIAGKEAMGFGDVKLMAALGLYFGTINIGIISVISFLLAAIISVGILIVKKKGFNDYIPFGPFIVVASSIVMFTPFSLLLKILLTIFTLGMYKG